MFDNWIEAGWRRSRMLVLKSQLLVTAQMGGRGNHWSANSSPPLKLLHDLTPSRPLSPDQKPFYVSRIESGWRLLRTCTTCLDSSITMTEIDWLLKSKQMLQQMRYWYWSDHHPWYTSIGFWSQGFKMWPGGNCWKKLEQNQNGQRCISKLSHSQVRALLQVLKLFTNVLEQH